MSWKTVSVELCTKRHIKAFLLAQFGEKPTIDSTHIFHNFLVLCLCHQLRYRIPDVPEYQEKMKIYITKRDYELYGCWLNPRQMQFFNGHVDFFMKTLLVAHADTYLMHHPKPKLKNALEYALEQIGVSDEDWDMETVKKAYYRSRLRRRTFLLKNKESLTHLSEYITQKKHA
jgi:hypothetical protein